MAPIEEVLAVDPIVFRNLPAARFDRPDAAAIAFSQRLGAEARERRPTSTEGVEFAELFEGTPIDVAFREKGDVSVHFRRWLVRVLGYVISKTSRFRAAIGCDTAVTS